MRKIINPYSKLDGYNCFGCAPDNKSGLRLEFYEDGDSVFTRWKPGNDYQGYVNILHGGIQATLIDEVASWTVYAKTNTSGVTSRLSVKYLKPVTIDHDQELEIRGTIVSMMRNLCNISVTIVNSRGEKCAEGDVQFFLFSKEKARKELNFRDIEYENV